MQNQQESGNNPEMSEILDDTINEAETEVIGNHREDSGIFSNSQTQLTHENNTGESQKIFMESDGFYSNNFSAEQTRKFESNISTSKASMH